MYVLYIMSNDDTQYMSQEKLAELHVEKERLIKEEIPTLAKRIDEARQMGDLSENAEYHAAREDMAWRQSRVKELDHLISYASVIKAGESGTEVGIGSRITVKVNGVKKEYMIVGAQEANPISGKISNESPLGQAFLGKSKGDSVTIQVPAGMQTYKILSVE